METTVQEDKSNEVCIKLINIGGMHYHIIQALIMMNVCETFTTKKAKISKSTKDSFVEMIDMVLKINRKFLKEDRGEYEFTKEEIMEYMASTYELGDVADKINAAFDVIIPQYNENNSYDFMQLDVYNLTKVLTSITFTEDDNGNYNINANNVFDIDVMNRYVRTFNHIIYLNSVAVSPGYYIVCVNSDRRSEKRFKEFMKRYPGAIKRRNRILPWLKRELLTTRLEIRDKSQPDDVFVGYNTVNYHPALYVGTQIDVPTKLFSRFVCNRYSNKILSAHSRIIENKYGATSGKEVHTFFLKSFNDFYTPACYTPFCEKSEFNLVKVEKEVTENE